MLLSAPEQIKRVLCIFPVPDKSNKIGKSETNEIILYSMNNIWIKQAYLKGFFSKFPTKRQINIFERMDIAESIYEGLSENF